MLRKTRKGEYGKKKRRGTLTWNMADTLTVCFFLGHVNVKSGFLDCSCLIDLVWKGLPRCQVKLSWIGCWQLSASSSIYDFPRSLRWTGAMLISWFFVLLCYVRFHRRSQIGSSSQLLGKIFQPCSKPPISIFHPWHHWNQKLTPKGLLLRPGDWHGAAWMVILHRGFKRKMVNIDQTYHVG